MSERIENRVVLGSLRYKSAPDLNLLFKVPLVQTYKENVEFDRNISIDLQQIYDDERQSSTIFRPISKMSLLFNNVYMGTTNYYPYKSSLYYENVKSLAYKICASGSTVLFSGFPQYYEFDFVRIDNDISGYTTNDSSNTKHLNFINKSAYTYNWSIYVSYVYDNLYNKKMSYYDEIANVGLNWVSSDGIPFVVSQGSDQSQPVISFRCPVAHGLSVGEFVKLSFNYDGIDSFQVYSLGDPFYGTNEYIFNIYNVGFTGTTFTNNQTGTFKRIIDITNSGETMSTYYVRQHKILTDEDSIVLGKSGFEQQIFKTNKKLVSSNISPNKQSRISIKNGSTVYTSSFSDDIDTSTIIDNHKRPISELYYSIIWKGYLGWTFGLTKSGGGFYGLKQGWEFNTHPLNINPTAPNTWWRNSNPDADTNFTMGSYTTPYGIPGKPFTYVKPPSKGDVFDGDYCEWNDYSQEERVISDMYHKFRFNPFYFNIGVSPNSNPFGDTCKGYYYKPLYPVKIRAYSDYVEEGNPMNVVGIPDYAYFSQNDNKFRWRDIYPYGYVDNDNIGVDYPFLNNAHYPYIDIIFRLIGEGSNYSYGLINNSVVAEPKIDECE